MKSEAVGARSAAERGSVFGAAARVLSRAELAAGELFLAGVTLLFLTVSVWWVGVDNRVPDPDSGRHVLLALDYLADFRQGEILAPFTEWHEYVPLVHLVAAIGSGLAGKSVATAVLSENLVFLPLLVLGCYGAGRVAFDRTVGVLAATFALASPMIVSVFHVVMLDGPEAALVATTVWLLLASERFVNRKYSLLAAVAVGVGFYSKQTFVFFVAGLVAVMLVRGGWRHHRTVLGFLGIVALIASPWYLLHYSDLRSQAEGAIVGGQTLWYGSVPYPDRWSLDNFTWYAWNFVNNQVYLPLGLFFFTGLGVAVWTLARRKPAGYLPELLVGAAVAYVAISLKELDDPRYMLPALVYVALLGTFWVTRLRPLLAFAASAALFLVFLVNLMTISLGRGEHVIIETPRSVDSPIEQWKLRVLNPDGYIIGGPIRDGIGDDLVDAFERARALGYNSVALHRESLEAGGFNLHGLGALAETADLPYVGPTTDAVSAAGISVFRAAPEEVPELEACVMSDLDGTGIFFAAGPLKERRLFCPR